MRKSDSHTHYYKFDFSVGEIDFTGAGKLDEEVCAATCRFPLKDRSTSKFIVSIHPEAKILCSQKRVKRKGN